MKKFFSSLLLLSFELIVVLLLFLVSLLSFAFITNRVFALNNTEFDSLAFSSILPYINQMNTSIMVFITFFAGQDFLLPANILLALYFLVLKKHRWYSVKVPVVAIGSFVVMTSVKMFFSRPRPLDPVYEAARGFSFPSGHAMSAMTFYGLIIYLVWKHTDNKLVRWSLAVLLSLFILLIGFSRVYLRVHYASDVLAGFALGLIWLVVSLWVIYWIENYARRNMAPSVSES